MVSIIKREKTEKPVIWINIHESGFKDSTIDFCVERIEKLCAGLFHEPREIQICIYDDIPASTGKAIGFVCDNSEIIDLAKDVQIEFNRIFGAKHVSVSLI